MNTRREEEEQGGRRKTVGKEVSFFRKVGRGMEVEDEKKASF